ncbi:hypothetical protein [Dasania marina]|uniref:hypothetical protein n=1 Tax=Dasania marina TaxID=471499 RepID=UPI0030DB3B06|tara:strand:+ start:69353 stop:70351 length:999 start_codon:yes stop_codon:yes gene_type:complete
MATVKTSKALHYKRAQFTNNEATLQQLLEQALSSSPKATDRQESLDNIDSVIRLINHWKEYCGMLCGQALVFTKGKGQQLVTLEDGVEEYPLNTMTAPVKGGNKQEFLESIFYFGIMENHLILLQSSSFGSRQFESHLGWFLGSKTGLLDANSALILMDKPAEAIYDKIKKSPAKAINIGTPLTTQAEASEVEPNETVDVKSIRYRPTGRAGNILQQVMGADWFNKLNLDEALDEANLKVNLQITYMRKTTDAGQAVLDNIAAAMRHMDEDDMSIDLKGGGKIKGKELRLSAQAKIDSINGVLIENDIYHAMHTWLVSLTSQQEIDGSQHDE